MKPKILIPWLVLLLTILGCGVSNSFSAMFESGTIAFEAPAADAAFHNPETEPPTIAITIVSTFETAKDARIYINGQGPIPCYLEANTKTACPPLPLNVGTNTLKAEVYKIDGTTIVSTETSVTWTPYSPLDLKAQEVAKFLGSEDPAFGYGFFAFIVLCIAMGFFLWLGGKWGGIFGFFFTLIALAWFMYFKSGSAGSALEVVRIIAGIVGSGFFVLVIYLFVKSGQSITAPYVKVKRIDADGTVTEMTGMQPWIGPANNAPQAPALGDSLARNAGQLTGGNRRTQGRFLPPTDYIDGNLLGPGDGFNNDEWR